MAKKNKSQKAKSDKNSPTGPKPSQTITPNSSNETDLPPLPNSAPTDSATGLGNRKGNPADDTTGAISDTAAGTLPSTGGLTIPGETVTGKKEGEDDKGSLQIKIHLNLHAKVKLELDAQIYGDIVIGLL
ncbi:hypothetical protein N7516_001714 [Penicillium verrucosum]|uniref:uncharacterized protein n=1 Tax=Penicillium verrucosum TaxID=60171 RepID=UPI0025456576|nr:uncharacterized protein N7516_001714 [Penicillium verrucosum]KAJ5941546.1 hypothetical protein N7516_001714 [Penicillium verrucosum]